MRGNSPRAPLVLDPPVDPLSVAAGRFTATAADLKPADFRSVEMVQDGAEPVVVGGLEEER